MSTHNLCFEQKFEKKYQNFLSENFPVLVVKFYVYLIRHVFVIKAVVFGGYCLLYDYLAEKERAGLKVIKLFSCATQLSMRFSLLLNMNSWLFDIFQQRHFHAQLCLARKNCSLLII